MTRLFFLDELEAIIREWVATVYHCRPHADLVRSRPAEDADVPGPAMFEHGLARAGYIEVPRDPHLAYEFLATRWRTIQHYGVEIDSRRYSGRILKEYGDKNSPNGGSHKNQWPFQVDPDDVTRIYFRDNEGHWHTLTWSTPRRWRCRCRRTRWPSPASLPPPSTAIPTTGSRSRTCWNGGSSAWPLHRQNAAWYCACPASRRPSTFPMTPPTPRRRQPEGTGRHAWSGSRWCYRNRRDARDGR